MTGSVPQFGPAAAALADGATLPSAALGAAVAAAVAVGAAVGLDTAPGGAQAATSDRHARRRARGARNGNPAPHARRSDAEHEHSSCCVPSGCRDRPAGPHPRPSFGGAVVPRTTSSGERCATGGSSDRRDDLGEQDLGAASSGLEQLLAHGRQPDVVGRLDVVVADHREVVGNVQPELPGGGDDAERLRVAGGEDGGRPAVAGEHAASQVAGLVAAVGTVTNPLGRDPHTGRGELIARARLAVRGSR